MGFRSWCLVIVLAAACAGDEPPPDGTCTGDAYQPCLEEHHCDSGLCQNFMGDGFQVCSQSCDASNPCPAGGECNMMGVCKPAAPVECELVF